MRQGANTCQSRLVSDGVSASKRALLFPLFVDSFDPKTYRIAMRAQVAVPLRLDGNYKIAGKVLVLPIQGEGLCSLVLGKDSGDAPCTRQREERGSPSALTARHNEVRGFQMTSRPTWCSPCTR